MPNYDRLLAASTQRERAASRRIAAGSGLSAEQALRQTLTALAGTLTLTSLVQARELLAAQERAKVTLRRAKKAEARALKLAALQPDPAAWLAWFDGSSHPNPGKLGIGGVLRSPTGETLEICRMAGHGDSNEAEYMALISVLEAALAAGAGQLVVYGDSQVVLNAVSAPMLAVQVAHLQELALHARQLATRITSIGWRWIPRQKNAAADALSQRAIEMFMNLDEHR